MCATGSSSSDTIELDELKPRFFGEVAVVTSLIKPNARSLGGRMTNVCARRNGQWQCVSSHLSGSGGFNNRILLTPGDQVDRHVIRRPFSCVVTTVFVKVGQSVKKGDQLVVVESDGAGGGKGAVSRDGERVDS